MWQVDGTATNCQSDAALNSYALVKPPAKARKSGSIAASASRNSWLASPKTVHFHFKSVHPFGDGAGNEIIKP